MIAFMSFMSLGNVEPMVNRKKALKKEIVTKEIKDNYQSLDNLIFDLDNIKKEKEITFSIEKSREALEKAELVLLVLDSTQDLSKEDKNCCIF